MFISTFILNFSTQRKTYSGNNLIKICHLYQPTWDLKTAGTLPWILLTYYITYINSYCSFLSCMHFYVLTHTSAQSIVSSCSSLTGPALYWIKVLSCLHIPPIHPERVQNSTFLLMLCFLILSIFPPITLLFLSLCPLLNKSPLLFHSYILSWSCTVAEEGR